MAAAGKYRLHSTASLVAVSVHASTMSEPLKEMCPSLRQLKGWDTTLLFIALEKLALPDISYYLSQGRCLIHICIVRKEVTSKQPRKSQGRICLDNCTCCHTETQAADPTCYLIQSQSTDTGPTSSSADLATTGARQGSH